MCYNHFIVDKDSELRVIKLYGIERGFLNYLPSSIPAIRDVSSLQEDVFRSCKPTWIQGRYCLHEQQIRAGIHLRVLKALGNTCIICGESHEKGMQVHHIKPRWRTLNNAFGFTVLCEECHKKIRGGIGKTDREVWDICKQISLPGSQWYDPPDGIKYPENSIVKVAHTPCYYLPVFDCY